MCVDHPCFQEAMETLTAFVVLWGDGEGCNGLGHRYLSLQDFVTHPLHCWEEVESSGPGNES